MDKFWADMIIEGKAKFADIKSESRKKGVKAILDLYLEKNIISKEEYNDILGIPNTDESEDTNG